MDILKSSSHIPEGKLSEIKNRTVKTSQEEWNQDLLHCRQILYQLSYEGNPNFITEITKYK